MRVANPVYGRCLPKGDLAALFPAPLTPVGCTTIAGTFSGSDTKESSGVDTFEASRNDVLIFAARARDNLQYIEEAAQDGVPVHPITQLALSLLGLIVFPHEQHLDQTLRSRRLDHLIAAGWPRWEE